ncbi:shikimate dehydrogenase family protein [Amorphus sp. MBR-141]
MTDRILAPTAAATVVAMIGSPVAHAHLPGTFNRRFAEEGMNAVMAPLDVAPERLGDFFAALRGWSNCRGCVVTAPHKRAAVDLVDEASAGASGLEAVNVVVREADGRLVGDNVDGEGFVHGLGQRHFTAPGKRAIVFGCGGAGSSIALSLADAGIGALHLVDVDPSRAEALAAFIASRHGVSLETGPPVSLADSDLVVNATAIGLDGTSMVHSLDTVRADALVADVLAVAELTPWLRRAQERGCAIQSGSAMAEGQFGLIAERFGLRLDLRR